jgi:hypothetical protein
MVLLQLMDMFTDHNPFITVYKTACKRLASQQTDFRVLFNPQIRLILESGTDCYYKNLSTSNEVTVLIPDEYTDASHCNLVLTVRKAGYKYLQIYTVNIIYIVYIPLYYILLFLYSDPGWYYELQLQDRTGTRQWIRLEQRAFYRYYLYIRPAFSPLFYTGRLFQ